MYLWWKFMFLLLKAYSCIILLNFLSYIFFFSKTPINQIWDLLRAACFPSSFLRCFLLSTFQLFHCSFGQFPSPISQMQYILIFQRTPLIICWPVFLATVPCFPWIMYLLWSLSCRRQTSMRRDPWLYMWNPKVNLHLISSTEQLPREEASRPLIQGWSMQAWLPPPVLF